MSSRHIESDPRALPGFLFWKAAANYAVVKPTEEVIIVAVGVLQRSHTSFDIIRIDSRLTPLYFPFVKSCAAVALCGTGQ